MSSIGTPVEEGREFDGESDRNYEFDSAGRVPSKDGSIDRNISDLLTGREIRNLKEVAKTGEVKAERNAEIRIIEDDS
jgi:hypothetical protein